MIFHASVVHLAYYDRYQLASSFIYFILEHFFSIIGRLWEMELYIYIAIRTWLMNGRL